MWLSVLLQIGFCAAPVIPSNTVKYKWTHSNGHILSFQPWCRKRTCLADRINHLLWRRPSAHYFVFCCPLVVQLWSSQRRSIGLFWRFGRIKQIWATRETLSNIWNHLIPNHICSFDQYLFEVGNEANLKYNCRTKQNNSATQNDINKPF